MEKFDVYNDEKQKRLLIFDKLQMAKGEANDFKFISKKAKQNLMIIDSLIKKCV